MMPRARAEIREIRNHIANLKAQSWLGPTRNWWPDYLFHCTDVRNVVSILRNGELLSRTQVLAAKQLQVDIASSEVIARTNLAWQDYVRLHFRPKAPTQYRNEGFRPLQTQFHQTQCPVPVYFLIGAESVLSQTGVLFTDGNVATTTVPTDDVRLLRTMPFESIYHNTWFTPQERDDIVYHRHAEVLVPQRLRINVIRFICCRSQAEYDTLLDLLPPITLHQWRDRIAVRPQLFFREWCFVEQVELMPESVRFRFHVGKQAGAFDARAEVIEMPTSHRLAWSKADFTIGPTLRLGMNSRRLDDYRVQFFLDNHLAYSGRFQDEPLPF